VWRCDVGNASCIALKSSMSLRIYAFVFWNLDCTSSIASNRMIIDSHGERLAFVRLVTTQPGLQGQYCMGCDGNEGADHRILTGDLGAGHPNRGRK
jgi:hypothetical protein